MGGVGWCCLGRPCSLYLLLAALGSRVWAASTVRVATACSCASPFWSCGKAACSCLLVEEELENLGKDGVWEQAAPDRKLHPAWG